MPPTRCCPQESGRLLVTQTQTPRATRRTPSDDAEVAGSSQQQPQQHAALLACVLRAAALERVAEEGCAEQARHSLLPCSSPFHPAPFFFPALLF
jgi:hypothetical protein